MNPQKDVEPTILATDLINLTLSTSGNYSDVYKCILTTGPENTLVAVKFIRFGRHKQYYERIIREIHLHMKLDHPNIIQLLGITKEFQGGSFPSLVFPWMPNGDLHCYIAYHGAGIEMSIKLSLARDIASGVAYLHKFHVVHGNLESKNVLMGPEPENRAYLTGFSLSTVLSTSELSNEYSNNPGKPRSGAVRFAAPECFIEEEGDNSLPMINSDIYSIGCILFHVFSGCLPWHYLKSNDIISGLRQHRTPSRPCGGGIDDSLWDFIERCWSFIPRNRPSAAQILNFFEKPYKLSGNGHVSPYDLTEMLPKILPAPIAFGSFADIRRCTLERDGKPLQVAVKSIRPLFNTEKTQRRYLHELRIWAALMQENILPLLGVAVIYGCCCPSMVCPWMENGTLSSYIRAYPTMELQHKLRLLRDVATGLRYLHSQHVVHGDLTNNNILVDVNGRAVVADFGLSCRLSEFSGSPHSALTAAAQWMAPELMQIPRESKSHISRHSDMYSFGSIMNYVISGELPFQNQAQPYFALHMGEAPFTERGKDVSQEHWKFIQRCWGPFNCDDGTSSRPSAEEACNFLRKELESKLLITK